VVERGQFVRYVADALNRVHDRWYLQGHPLAALLAGGGRRLEPAALQRLLYDAIRDLRPQADGPLRDAAWRKYRHLVLRCVDALPPTEVARRLGVSERQARRDHHEAVEAVADLLWHLASAADATPRAVDEASDDALEDELARVGAAPTGPVQLAAILRRALETVGPLASGRGARVELDLPTDLPPVAADAGVLRHMLLSLLSAAVDREGASCVGVSVAAREDEVEARVDGRGQGGPGADEPALGADHAASLRAAARLAQLQGASLEWRDGGGEFAARLRLRVFRPTTVLMVDDNPDFVRLFRRYVSGGPYRIVEAKVADEAVPLAASVRPDLVMLDLMMPSQDGWSILQQLKRGPDTREIPVVVCSVLRERSLALSLGAADFLPKPITQSTLLACLARHCAAPGAAAPAGTASPRRPSGPPGD
jgi:CheY-like chemotaxis protein